jgi:hypothetical protein
MLYSIEDLEFITRGTYERALERYDLTPQEFRRIRRLNLENELSSKDIRILKNCAPQNAAEETGMTALQVYEARRRLGIRQEKRPWTPEDIAYLKEHGATKETAKKLGRSQKALRRKRDKLEKG